jgi:4-amino-4-deoxy-L-arabinose transferase-like glycosyltransferase
MDNPEPPPCATPLSPAPRPRARVSPRLLVAASVAVYVALRLRSIWSPRLWGDEVFNYSLSQGTWVTILKRAALDMAHPPLFYLLLKPWVQVVGGSLSGLRVIPVAISVAAVVPFLALARELRFGKRETALALGLMAVNEYLILYSYYLRPYSLLLFFTLCSHFAFIRFLRSEGAGRGRALFFLTVVNTLFVYTHYFAWLVVAAEYLWACLTDRRRLLPLSLAGVVAVVCTLPWVGVIVYTSTRVPYTFLDQISWESPPDARDVVLLLRSFNGGLESAPLTFAGGALFLIIMGCALRRPTEDSHRDVARRGPKALNEYALLAWLAAFPLVVSLAAGYAFTFIWMPRYVIVSATPYLLLAAGSALRLRRRATRAAATAFLLAWATLPLLTGDLTQALHGPDAPSYWLARDLARAEMRGTGPIRVYGLSPYAEQGLRLALSTMPERRFELLPYPVGAPPDDHYWIALTEHDTAASERVRELALDPRYSLGEPLYAGLPPQRHILVPVQRR